MSEDALQSKSIYSHEYGHFVRIEPGWYSLITFALSV